MPYLIPYIKVIKVFYSFTNYNDFFMPYLIPYIKVIKVFYSLTNYI